MSYIYKIVNEVNNKLYIGKTSHTTLEERLKEHFKDSLRQHQEKRPLYEAFKKYGINNFHIELIEEVENDIIASEREEYWINVLRTYIGFDDCNGYNATLGGDGKRLYDYKFLANEYLKLGTAKAVCQKYHCDIQTVRQACKENNIPIKFAPNQRAIKRIDTDGQIKIYSSITEAAKDIPNKATETARKNIQRALIKHSSGYGYKWEYL